MRVNKVFVEMTKWRKGQYTFLRAQEFLNWNCLSPEKGGDVLVVLTMTSRLIILWKEEN